MVFNLINRVLLQWIPTKGREICRIQIWGRKDRGLKPDVAALKDNFPLLFKAELGHFHLGTHLG